MCATILRLFGCLASLDGALVTNSLALFLDLSDNHFLGVVVEPLLPSHVEREETLNTPLCAALQIGSCFVCMDIGSSEQLAMQNLQIPDIAETRIILKWLFPPRFSDKNRFTSQPSRV